MNTISAILGASIYNNTVEDYTIALAVFCATIFTLHIVKTIILNRIRSLAKPPTNEWDNVAIGFLNSIDWPLYFTGAVYLAVHYIQLTEFTNTIINTIINTLTTIVIGFYAIKISEAILRRAINLYIAKQSDKSRLDKTIISFINTIIRILLWLLVGLIVLENLGFNVTVLLGGLGVAGIAVGFALQSILADFFAFFSIYFDKPFKRGDFIVIGADKGTVVHIGIKSTRIQTLQGEELIVSNQELTSVRVNNFKKMEKRRIEFTFGVVYDTPNAKLKKIPTIVRKIIRNEKLASIDRVHFTELGDYSLNFEVVYFILDKDFKKYRDAQQRINLKLKDIFEKEGIEFAHPTQTLFHNSVHEAKL